MQPMILYILTLYCHPLSKLIKFDRWFVLYEKYNQCHAKRRSGWISSDSFFGHDIDKLPFFSGRKGLISGGGCSGPIRAGAKIRGQGLQLEAGTWVRDQQPLLLFAWHWKLPYFSGRKGLISGAGGAVAPSGLGLMCGAKGCKRGLCGGGGGGGVPDGSHYLFWHEIENYLNLVAGKG